jgi:hypothetical protein
MLDSRCWIKPNSTKGQRHKSNIEYPESSIEDRGSRIEDKEQANENNSKRNNHFIDAGVFDVTGFG